MVDDDYMKDWVPVVRVLDPRDEDFPAVFEAYWDPRLGYYYWHFPNEVNCTELDDVQAWGRGEREDVVDILHDLPEGETVDRVLLSNFQEVYL